MKRPGPAISKWPTIPVPPDVHRLLVREAYARCREGGDITEAMAGIVEEAMGLWQAHRSSERERIHSREFAETIAGGPISDEEHEAWKRGEPLRVRECAAGRRP